MKFRYLLLALVATSAVIWLSSLPAGAGDSSFAWRVLSNSAHVPIYAILTILWLLTFSAKKNKNRFFIITVAVFFGMIFFALTDELHQSFVAGRTASFWDIVLDILGIVAGVYIFIFSRRVKCFTSSG